MRARTVAVVAALLGATLAVAGTAAVDAQTRTCFGRAATIIAQPNVVTEGTSGPDVIIGTSGPDVILGRGGNDRICSLGGADDVRGGKGDDRIRLGKGADSGRGGSGADLIYGNSGRDQIWGNSGPDRLRGGPAADTVSGGSGADNIKGGSGADDLAGKRGDDVIDGGRGLDTCRGGPGDDDLTSCNESAGTFTAGTYRVGTDIAPGRYESAGSDGCYWERLSGLSGGLDDILANDFQNFSGPIVVDLLASDAAFSFDADCGSFRPYTSPASPASQIFPGAHVVGSDIAPGTYRADADQGCYWERRSSHDGTLASVLANDFVGSAGPVLVEIAPTDDGFYADADCGTWVRQ